MEVFGQPVAMRELAGEIETRARIDPPACGSVPVAESVTAALQRLERAQFSLAAQLDALAVVRAADLERRAAALQEIDRGGVW